jgi:hypothetical protein
MGSNVRPALYDRVWLVTEGIWRAGEEGVFEVLAGGGWRPTTPTIMAQEVDAWLLTQTIRGGVSYWHCPTRRDTARFLASLYHWWTDKAFDKHRSHQAIYSAPPDRAMLIEPSNFVKGLVGLVDVVGWAKAAEIEEACDGSFNKLGMMTAKELQTIKGVGKVIAERIVKSLQGGHS